MSSIAARGRTALAIVIGLVLSILAAWIAVRGVDLDETIALVAAGQWEWLPLVIAAIGAQTVVRAERWRQLLPSAGGAAAPSLRRVLPVTLVGYLANVVLPARLGEAVRVAVISRREALPFTDSFGSIVLERVLDTLTLATIGLAAVLLVGVSGDVRLIAIGGLALGIAATAAIVLAPRIAARVPQSVATRVRSVLVAVARGADVRGRRGRVATAIALSAIAWGLDATIFSMMARALGIDLTLDRAMVIATVAALSTAIPAAPGYVGTFELATAFAAQAVGVGPAAALGLAVTVHAVSLVTVAAAGIVAAIIVGSFRPSAPVDAPSAPDRSANPGPQPPA